MEEIKRELNGGTRSYSNSIIEDSVLSIRHNSGPFSCSTIALQDIMIFYNDKKKLPNSVLRDNQYGSCKSAPTEDFSKYLFEEMDIIHFDYDGERYVFDSPILPEDVIVEGTYPAHGIYKDIKFDDVKPFLIKYFYPSVQVQECISHCLFKYNIDVENTCYILYRGQDKAKEMPMDSYESFVQKALSCCDKDTTYFIQTDESEFLDYCKVNLPKVIFIEECVIYPVDPHTPLIDKVLPEYKSTHMIYYLSSIIIGSQCKYAITHTGNGGFWLALYRGHSENLYQSICGNTQDCGGIFHKSTCFNIWI